MLILIILCKLYKIRVHLCDYNSITGNVRSISILVSQVLYRILIPSQSENIEPNPSTRLLHLPPERRLRATGSSLLFPLLELQRASLLPLDGLYVLYTSLLLFRYPLLSRFRLFPAYSFLK